MALTQISTKGLKDGTILNADVSASAAIDGTKISPSFTSDIILTNANPSISLLDSDANSDFKINVNGGIFSIKDQTNVDATRLAINSPGNVGIGTTNPAVKFVVSNGGAEGLEISHSSGTVDLNAYNRSTSARSPVGIVGQTFTVATGNPSLNTGLFQNSSGLVGIGTTNPTSLLTLNHATSPFIRLNDSDTTKCAIGADGGLSFVSALDNNPLVFTTDTGTAFTERMRIATDGLITAKGDIRVDRGVAGVDGILGQAYGGYFGLKHADQSINQEYMILNNGVDHTYISCSSNGGVYIRPDANSVTHETFFGIDTTYYKTNIHITDQHSLFFGASNDLQILHNATGNRNEIISTNHDFLLLSNDKITFQLYASGNSNNQEITRITNNELINFRNIRLGSGMRLTRTTHQSGHLEGGYDNIGNSGAKSNPIFTIGSNYNPAETTLSNMYGIGFCTDGASFINSHVTSNWGMYVAADGDARIFLGGSDGRIFADGAYGRTAHQTGHLEGGHTNISSTDIRTSPIYTIGSAYNPAASTLSNMYGVGFSHGNASFTPSGVGWGMYVAADGNARIFADGSYGNIHFHDGAQGSVVFNNGGWSGDKSTGKIQTHSGHLYMQNAGNTSSFAFRLPNGTEAFVINYQGGTSSSDRRLKKDITTITGAVDTIKKLIGRSFTWKEADVKAFGVIAQEIEPILPEVISTQTVIEGQENEDPYKMMNYGALSGHFIEAIKELAAKIEALETEVATLKAS